MGITISEEELDTCKRLLRPAYVALALTNDLFSWEKEYDVTTRKDLEHVSTRYRYVYSHAIYIRF